ncbi:MAG: aromatic amino acid transaminase [Gammaproteobacteria bacterium]
MFESLEPLPADPLLGLIAEHRKDPRSNKIDLGVGVYKNVEGETRVLDVVKLAEHKIVDSQQSKSYLGTAGRALFNSEMQHLVFGDSAPDERIVTVQAPGGSGALRLGAELVKRAHPDASVWVPDETWSNHTPLLGSAGLNMKTYPYYDSATHSLRIDQMLEALKHIPENDIIVLHACCHNPTGVDPTNEQWRDIVDAIEKQKLVPLFDTAYLGFAVDLEADTYSIRYATEKLEELIITSSCSKNFGLYRERVGALSMLTKSSDEARILASQASLAARTMYSMPPDHGAAIVACILSDDALRSKWHVELNHMRDRLSAMRTLLHSALKKAAPEHNFDHLVRSKGMFCYLGISADKVKQLKQDNGIYMAGSSRINVAGITPDNVGYLADSIKAVL